MYDEKLFYTEKTQVCTFRFPVSPFPASPASLPAGMAGR
jgi:hypothetical protein